MTAPAIAAGRFFLACGVGAILALLYGFLRPPRQHLTHVCDLIFVLAAFAGWVYVGFGIYRGNLGVLPGCAMLLGGLLWENTAGRLLRPLFRGFWKILAAPFRKIFRFFHKNKKNYLQSTKKRLQ